MSCRRSVTGFSCITGILYPDRVYPLQQPWAQVDVASRIDPQTFSFFCTCSTNIFEKVCPCFPHVARVVHIIVAANHMVMIGCITRTGSKSVPFPVIDIESCLIIDDQIFKVLQIFMGTCTDNIAQCTVVLHVSCTHFFQIFRKSAKVVVAALRTYPQTESRLQFIRQ